MCLFFSIIKLHFSGKKEYFECYQYEFIEQIIEYVGREGLLLTIKPSE